MDEVEHNGTLRQSSKCITVSHQTRSLHVMRSKHDAFGRTCDKAILQTVSKTTWFEERCKKLARCEAKWNKSYQVKRGRLIHRRDVLWHKRTNRTSSVHHLDKPALDSILDIIIHEAIFAANYKKRKSS